MAEYKFNSMNYLPGGTVTVGPVKKKTYFVDGSDAYANNRKLFISFHHVPTGKDVFFKAFITAFNETYNSDWSSESVYGRADPIYLFKQTQRQITLAFKIPASTTGEAYENLGKVQTLVQFLYPNYTDVTNATTVSQSPLVRLKVMNLLQNTNDKLSSQDVKYAASPTAGQPYAPTGDALEDWSSIQSYDSHDGLLGVLDNVTVNHNLEGDDGAFVIGNRGSVLPKFLDVNLSFKAIHEHPLGWDEKGQFATGGGQSRLWPYGISLEEHSGFSSPDAGASATVNSDVVSGLEASDALIANAQAQQAGVASTVTVSREELPGGTVAPESHTYAANTAAIENSEPDLNTSSATDIYDDEEFIMD